MLCSRDCRCAYSDYQHYEQKHGRKIFYNEDGALQVQECQGYLQKLQLDFDFGEVLEFVETEFECSGLCSRRHMRLFSDVNEQVKDTCLNALLGGIVEKFKYYLVVGSLYLLVFGLDAALCVVISAQYAARNKRKYQEWKRSKKTD